MHAIIKTGGKQYRVAPGDVIQVEKLDFDTGTQVDFPLTAIFNDDGQLLSGADVTAARVRATVTANDRHKKILVFKFKRKKQYKKTIGHRQHYTELQVNEILT